MTLNRTIIHFMVLMTAVLSTLVFGGDAAAHVRMENPIGGEVLSADDSLEIIWNAYIWHGPGEIVLQFSSDGGENYEVIFSGIRMEDVSEAIGSVSWTVPDVNSADCHIYVRYIGDGGPVYSSTSGAFTIGTPEVSEGEGEPMIGQFMELVAVKDATLFEDAEGDVANGAGSYIFAGNTNNGSARRGMLTFDVAGAVPEDSIILSVTLSMTMSKTPSPVLDETITLVPVLVDWGEGTSDASGEEGGGTAATSGDATWLHSFYDTTPWTDAGGDFVNTASADLAVGATGNYTWSSTDALVADVQGWLDHPESNFGWFVFGNESAVKTAKRFNSREHPTASSRPTLTVNYAAPAGSITPSTRASLIEADTYLALSAPAGGSNYHWMKNGIEMADSPPRLTGTHEETLVFDLLDETDSGVYICLYDDGSGAKVAQLTAPYVLDVLPANSVPLGGMVLFGSLLGLMGAGALMLGKKN
jgi:hypothetical protein